MSDFYEEIEVVDKLDYVKKNFPERAEWYNSKVKCLHCDGEFEFKEYKVVKDKCSGEEFIVCKNFPNCNGSIIDFM